MANILYELFDKTEKKFWENLLVNLESYCENWENKYKKQLNSRLLGLNELTLKEIISKFNSSDILKVTKKEFLYNT